MYYSVNLLYKCQRSDGLDPLWEERIILVSAVDESEAESKAITFSKKTETSFITNDGTNIIWKFYQIERIFHIDDDLVDGTELFSRFLRNSEAESILTTFED